jgi:hypothetical protein
MMSGDHGLLFLFYQYYNLHDGRHPGDELKKDWMEMILTRLEQYLLK